MADSPPGRRPSGIPGRSLSLVPTHLSSSGNCIPRDNRVVINVGGIRYETYRSTLKNIPDTRLSWLTETKSHNTEYDLTTGEYFFDRHPGVFNMVLNYYRTGRLHAPSDVCGPLFEEELAFWGIDEKQIEPCCWMGYRTHRDAQETLKELDVADDSDEWDDTLNVTTAQRFGIHEDALPPQSTWQRIRPKVWDLLEDPYSGPYAQVVAVISVIFVLVSILDLCLETHIDFRVPINPNITINESWSQLQKNSLTKPHPALAILDLVCSSYFTLELILRFLFCPQRSGFFRTVLNWVDFFSIVPVYLEYILIAIQPDLAYTPALQYMKTVRIIRIFRIFKLTRHFSGLKILVHTVRASARELILLIIFLLISILIFASSIYYAEMIYEYPKNDFTSIPLGFWWAVVTMTTLGYGDMYPRTGFGCFIGSICAVGGVLVLALPVPVIVNNFALYYSHAQAKLKLPKKTKKVLVSAPDALKTQSSLPGVEMGESEHYSPSRQPNAASSPSNSTRSIQSLDTNRLWRESSETNGSIDSSVRSGDLVNRAANGEPASISVIYTDELGELPPSGTYTHHKRSRRKPLPLNSITPTPYINSPDIRKHNDVDRPLENGLAPQARTRRSSRLYLPHVRV